MKTIQKRRDLGGTWQWKEKTAGKWKNGQVPGSVLSDLLPDGSDDPYSHLNERVYRELLDQDFIYRRSFELSDEDFAADALELVCEGIDTLAAIYLNGRKLADVANMHRSYRFSIRADSFSYYTAVGLHDEDPRFSDNYFDITSKGQLDIRSVADSF